jgi:predicted DNA-binding protein
VLEFQVVSGLMTAPIKSERRRGRPPTRFKDGQPVRLADYEKLTVYLEPLVKGKLTALSNLLSKPAWKLIQEAIEAYIQRLPKTDQKLVEEVATRALKIASEKEEKAK